MANEAKVPVASFRIVCRWRWVVVYVRSHFIFSERNPMPLPRCCYTGLLTGIDTGHY
jgi:hypothetical protein